MGSWVGGWSLERPGHEKLVIFSLQGGKGEEQGVEFMTDHPHMRKCHETSKEGCRELGRGAHAYQRVTYKNSCTEDPRPRPMGLHPLFICVLYHILS